MNMKSKQIISLEINKKMYEKLRYLILILTLWEINE